MSYEDQVNNSHMIKDEFDQKNLKYFPPWKTKRCFSSGRSGKVRVFTEEERFLYRVREISKSIRFEV